MTEGFLMATVSQRRATIDDLLRTEGKAELIGGRIVRLMPSGHTPNQVAFETAVSLREYARQIGRGVVYADGMGFTVPELPSGRQSFCPDAAYYVAWPTKNDLSETHGGGHQHDGTSSRNGRRSASWTPEPRPD